MRAKSAVIRKDPGSIEMELQQQQQKSKILDEDRKNFHLQAEQIKEKHREEIEKLKNQNQHLKNIKDQFLANRKKKRGYSTNDHSSFASLSTNSYNNKDENYLRRLLDKERFLTKRKKAMLFNLQDKLKEVEENKLGYIEENPLMRNIRVLENRLDKVMIKYNEAQSVQKTYEEVLKRLKQERVGYDSQLAIIQSSLKGKQHDFQELLLLAHDATHAKEASYGELKRFQQRRGTVQDMRTKYLNQKKQQINKNVPTMMDQSRKLDNRNKTRKGTAIFTNNYEYDESYQKQQLNDYEEAFRKLKQVTGVLDANEIIQKFKTQGLTTNSLEELRQSYKNKIEELKEEKDEEKKRLQENKFIKEKGTGERRRVDQIEADTAKVSNQLERTLIKADKLSNVLISTKAGVEHLKDLTAFYKREGENEVMVAALQDDLKFLNDKLRRMYDVVKSDPNYLKGSYKANTQQILGLLNERDESGTAKYLNIDEDEQY